MASHLSIEVRTQPPTGPSPPEGGTGPSAPALPLWHPRLSGGTRPRGQRTPREWGKTTAPTLGGEAEETASGFPRTSPAWVHPHMEWGEMRRGDASYLARLRLVQPHESGESAAEMDCQPSSTMGSPPRWWGKETVGQALGHLQPGFIPTSVGKMLPSRSSSISKVR